MKVDWTKVGAFVTANKHHFLAVAVALFAGLLMFAGAAEGDQPTSIGQWIVDAGKWVVKNRQVVGLVLLVVGLAAVYTPRAWFHATIVQGWSWRVAGCYTVGLLLGTAVTLTTLYLGDGWAYVKVVAILYFLAIAGLSALAAHWQPAWTAPSFGYLGFVAVFMAMVPAWIAITQAARSVGN